jgi:hypothetical protein
MNIQMIPAHSHDIECPICLELIHNSCKKITACNHVFHRTCLIQVRTNACPLCRQPFRATRINHFRQATTTHESNMDWINSEDIEDALNQPFEQFRGTGRLEVPHDLPPLEITRGTHRSNLLQF